MEHIPIVKFDPTLPALDPFCDGHQRPTNAVTEGWVTIHGAHVLIGNDGPNVYHGTAGGKLQSIMKTGLKSSDGVYVTSDKNSAKGYALERANGKGEVGLVVVAKKAGDFLPADEKPGVFISPKTVAPEHIKRIEIYKTSDLQKSINNAKPVRVIQHAKEATDTADEIFVVLAQEALTEGWVTIDGRHVLIGDETDKMSDKMSGGADYHKPFTGMLSPVQMNAFDNINKSLAYAYTGEGQLPSNVTVAAKELASSGFSPDILKVSPLHRVSLDPQAADALNAQAFYNEQTHELTLNTNAPDAVIVHEIGHHLDLMWSRRDGENALTRAYRVDPNSVTNSRQAALQEYSDTKKSGGEGISTYSMTLPHEWIAEGVRQYAASAPARAALRSQFPKTYGYVRGLLTGDFK